MKELGTFFQQFRSKSGLSQRDLSKKSGVMQCTISRFESGLQGVSMPTLVKLAKAIGSRELMRIIQKEVFKQLS